jgi:hypothetical protein
MKKILLVLIFLACFMNFPLDMSAQIPDDFPEFTITNNGDVAPGYLFGSSSSKVDSIGSYYMIIDDEGTPLFHSQTRSAGRLLLNGYFGTAIPLGPKHQYIWHIKDQDFNIVDSVQMGLGQIADNHDFVLLPNGHFIMLAYEIKYIDMSKLVEGGSPHAKITGSVVQELDADRNVIYQWSCWDHIPILDTYKDVKKSGFDYIHVNSVELDHDGNIILSCRETSEIIKISRQTGETIWRWGGKNNDFSILGDHEENAPRYFKLTHSVRRLPNGNIIMFDNGADKNDKERTYSRAVEYEMDIDNMETTMAWEFRHDPDILALSGGTVRRFSNGNTQINWGGAVRDFGAPAYTEANPAGELAYEIAFASKDVQGNFSRYLWFDLAPVFTATHAEVTDPNTYEFIQGDTINTGISVKVNSFEGDGYNELTVKREGYGPLYPEFIGRPPRVFAERITVSELDITAINMDIIFNLDEFDFTDHDTLVIYHRESPGSGLFIPLPTEYNSIQKTLKATATAFGEFVVGKPDIEVVTVAPWPLFPAMDEIVSQDEELNMNWSPQGYFADFDLQIAFDSSFVNVVLDTSQVKGITFEFADPMQDTTYYWRLRTNNEAGTSEWSDTLVFHTAPAEINILSPEGGEEIYPGGGYWIKWWDNFSEEVTIMVLKDGALVTEPVTVDRATGNWEWDIPSDFTLGTGYQVVINSASDSTITDTSEVFSVLDIKAPDAVCTDTTIYLDAEGMYTIDSSYVDNGSKDDFGIAAITLSKTDFNCDDLGENLITVTVTDVNGNESTCEATVTATDTMDACVSSVNLKDVADGIAIYPNPAKDELTISYVLEEIRETEIRLYDILGHEVMLIFAGRQLPGSYDFRVDLSNLNQSNYYILRMRSGESVRHHKVMIMR